MEAKQAKTRLTADLQKLYHTYLLNGVLVLDDLPITTNDQKAELLKAFNEKSMAQTEEVFDNLIYVENTTSSYELIIKEALEEARLGEDSPAIAQFQACLAKANERITTLTEVMDLEEEAQRLRKRQAKMWQQAQELGEGVRLPPPGNEIWALREDMRRLAGVVAELMGQVQKLREEGGMPKVGGFRHAMEGIVPFS